MAYDHHTKSGNQGDVIKHVALLAALDGITSRTSARSFKFADLFSGYAQNLLLPGNEWSKGIALVSSLASAIQNTHVQEWRSWYIPHRPVLECGTYPGSSVIAADVCRKHNKIPRIAAWDISPDVVQNLRAVFNNAAHRIYPFASSLTQPGAIAALRHASDASSRSKWRALHPVSFPADVRDVLTADFLFVDPPGLRSAKHPAYPEWATLLDVLSFCKADLEVPFLVWLPVCRNTSANASSHSIQQVRADAIGAGFKTTEVWWRGSNQQGMMGCVLIYDMPAQDVSALRDAVDDVTQAFRWIHQPQRHEPPRPP